MSDNPADSLRRELETAMHHHESGGSWDGCPACIARIEAISPLITAALEAARADERERIAKAIEAQVPGEDEIDTWSVGYMRGMEASAVIARSPARRAVSDDN